MTKPRNPLLRALVEVGFIVFLFYANLLMGEFTAHSGVHKTWSAAFADMVTARNFEIGLVAAVAGYAGFEALRRRV